MLQHPHDLNAAIVTTKLFQCHPSSPATKIAATTTPLLQHCYQIIITMKTPLL
jgi:hypothetical protein